MIRLAYNLLIAILSPVWLPWMVSRTKKRKEAPNWAERWGRYQIPPKSSRPRAWIHAVSVGEVIAARPILTALRDKDASIEVVLTTTTSTGHEMARSLLGKTVDYLFYFPIDFSPAVKRAIAAVRPDVVAIMETELWMNFLYFSKRFGSNTMLVNGRVSSRSFERSKRVSFFYKALLSNLDLCLMQTEVDAERISKLGARVVEVFGNSKYDEAVQPETAAIRQGMNALPDKPFIVVGSARGEFEEDFILDALVGIDARILFAPRHVERSYEVLEKAAARGFNAGLRSMNQDDSDLLVLDTYGELASTYAGATVAIIGGGFDNLGGQNIIQPLAVGCPVVCGQNMANFREPFEEAQKANALLVAATPEQLRSMVLKVLKEPELAKSMALAGKKLIESRRGASVRYAQAIAEGVQ